MYVQNFSIETFPPLEEFFHLALNEERISQGIEITFITSPKQAYTYHFQINIDQCNFKNFKTSRASVPLRPIIE